MVLLKDDNHPSFRWEMCRVVKVVNGVGGKNRVVFVKTPQGFFKRGYHNYACCLFRKYKNILIKFS